MKDQFKNKTILNKLQSLNLDVVGVECKKNRFADTYHCVLKYNIDDAYIYITVDNLPIGNLDFQPFLDAIDEQLLEFEDIVITPSKYHMFIESQFINKVFFTYDFRFHLSYVELSDLVKEMFNDFKREPVDFLRALNELDLDYIVSQAPDWA